FFFSSRRRHTRWPRDWSSDVCSSDLQATETKAHDGNLTTAVRELGHRVGGILNVSGAGVPVISLVEAKAVLPVGLGGDTKVDTGLLMPEQVGRDRNQALFRQFVAGLANVGVHPEHLVQNDDGGSRQGLRPRDISAKRAVPAFNGDAIFHCVLLRGRLSGPPPMSSSGSAEAHYRAKRVQHGGPALRLAKRHFHAVAAAP